MNAEGLFFVYSSFQDLYCFRGLNLKLFSSVKPERALVKVKVPNQALKPFKGLFLTLLSPLKHLRVWFRCTGPLLNP